jgi:Leucine-rich repeat (LRR) protein
MKKGLLILLCLPLLTLAQQTYVPDNNFESYLEGNGMGNGIPNDDSVTTSNIDTITSLNVNGQSISDLTGIEDFTALSILNCSSNELTSLDLSNKHGFNEFKLFFQLSYQS